MTPLEQIAKWSENLPLWQQDTVRRLMISNAITTKDLDEVYDLAKKENAIIKTEVAPIPKPFKINDVLSVSEQKEDIRLSGLKNVQFTNRIDPSQTTIFGHKGITAVFGANGSGKSGFARVLKAACRSRDSEKILGNVFGTAALGTPQAEFDILRNKKLRSLNWIWPQKPEELSSIAFFDEKCARVIVNEENQPSYLPYGMDVFERLGEIVRGLKERLQKEKPKKPEFDFIHVKQSTKAEKKILQFNANTTKDEIERESAWTEEDATRLAEIQDALTKTTDENSKASIVTERAFIARADKLFMDLGKISEAISESEQLLVSQLISDVEKYSKALKTLAQDFSGMPIPGVGSELWIELYKAAKKFSTEVAYFSKPFPYSGEDAKCVLCMQPVRQDAEDRFIKFKTFMEDELNSKYQTARNALDQKLATLMTIQSRENFFSTEFGNELRLRDPQLAEETLNRIDNYMKVRETLEESIRNLIGCKDILKVISPSTKPAELKRRIESSIKLLDEATNPEKRLKIQLEYNELISQNALCDAKNKLLGYVGQLKLIQLFDIAIATCNPSKITSEGKKLISSALSKELLENLSRELESLGLTHFAVIPKMRGKDGATLHQLELNGASLPKGAQISDVLSEGENRVLAIAGFLAELKTTGHNGTIIFDDPVSSVDHEYRERIALRLCSEAENRQVIVFTHDLVFMLQLDEITENRGTPFFGCFVERKANSAGHYSKDMPWFAKKCNERLLLLEKRVAYAAKIMGTPENKEYEVLVRDIYGGLRETWERAIEEVLFGGTIQRYQKEIKTQSLKEITIEQSDYGEIDTGMIKCSRFFTGHDKSPSNPIHLPSPNEMANDIKNLREFIKKVKDRKKIIAQARERAGSFFDEAGN